MTPRRKPRSAPRRANGSTPTRPRNSRRSFRNPRSAASGCRTHDIVEVGKAWQKKKAEGGWACLHWPKEYGGRGATPIERVIWQQEEGVYGKLTQPVPDRRGHVRADGDGLWQRGATSGAICRSSLPARRSGASCSRSPPAAPTSRACAPAPSKKGDHWIINGQKIWTSGAHYSDYGLLDHPHRSQCAQAQGPDHVLPRHEEQRRRGQADQAGQRHAGIQRGVFHRRA